MTAMYLEFVLAGFGLPLLAGALLTARALARPGRERAPVRIRSSATRPLPGRRPR